MKILITLVVATMLLICSCAPRFYPWGMTLNQFVKENHDAQFVEGNAHYSVYSRDTMQIGGAVTRHYFYFQEGKLFAIDEGQKVPDITIQINNG